MWNKATACLVALLLLPSCTAFQPALPPRPRQATSLQAASSHDDSSSRRQVLAHFASLAATASLLTSAPRPAFAKASLPPYPAQVTNKVEFEIRVTGFVTGEEKATNEETKGNIVIGLFGKDAPLAVGQFLQYSKAAYAADMPSYSFSSFVKCTPGVSVQAGRIKGLKQIEIAGTQGFEYGDKLLGAKGMDEPKLSLKHDRRGLLTKGSQQDAIDSIFEITLGPQPALDNGDSIVFGQVLEGQEVLDAIEAVPIYTYESAGEQPEALNNIFANQKKLFLSVAKSFNDERAVNREGTFLKRVEVLNVRVL